MKPEVLITDKVSEFVEKTNQVSNNIGDPEAIITGTADIVVDGVNELDVYNNDVLVLIGDINLLNTEINQPLTYSINEIYNDIEIILGGIELEYDGEVLRLDGKIDDNDEYITQTNAIIGTLSNLDTTDQSSLVAAVNELDTETESTFELPEIANQIMTSANVVDVFIYDTSKDSDGGMWRNRCQDLSWYNEELNTSTRGRKREFPAVALIVTETNKVTIYDATDPGCPMWMVFNVATGNLLASVADSIFCRNAIVCFGNSPGLGLRPVWFLRDEGLTHWTVGATRKYNGNISQRNNLLSFTNITYLTNIINNYVNDVAMTVLDNAPIDQTTGLPVPTIAVATDGGVSVIDGPAGVGTVVDQVYVAGGITKVAFHGDRLTWLSKSAFGILFSAPIKNYLADYSFGGIAGHVTNYGGEAYGVYVGSYEKPAYFPLVTDENVVALSNGSMDVGSSIQGLSRIKSNPSVPTKGMVANITDEYNSGWQHGDIKGAFLADTTEETIGLDTTEELVTNGTFDTDTSGWTADGVTLISIDAGRLKVENGGALAKAWYPLDTIIGQTYRFKVEAEDGAGASTPLIQIRRGNGPSGSTVFSYSGIPGDINTDITFKALDTKTSIILGDNGAVAGKITYYDNVSVKPIQNLVENGEFSSDRAWVEVRGTASFSGGTVTITTSAGETNGRVQQDIPTKIGAKYLIKAKGDNIDATSPRVYFAGSYFVTNGSENSGIFTANLTETELTLMALGDAGESVSFDYVEIYELAEQDRSVNANHLQVVGQLTKSPVAAGADLVAYNGFSNINYLQQTYNTDLNFGTGDFYVKGWAYRLASGTYHMMLDRRSAGTTGFGFYVENGIIKYVLGSVVTTPLTQPLERWHQVFLKRESGVLYIFIDGQEVYQAAAAGSVNLGSEQPLYIGTIDPDFSSVNHGWLGSLALWHIGAGAPTDDQIKFIYDTERKLFEENAKCTISNPSIVTLSYDEITKKLYVGTSTGINELQDLLVLSKNTVSTQNIKAISAYNDKLLYGTTVDTQYRYPGISIDRYLHELAFGQFIGDEKEDYLGLPGDVGYFLQSDKTGRRYWSDAGWLTGYYQAEFDYNTAIVDIDTIETDIVDAEGEITVIEGNITTLEGKIPYKIDSYNTIGDAGANLDLDAATYDSFEFNCNESALELTVSNFVSGRLINLIITNGDSCAIIWPSGILFPDGDEPDLNSKDRLILQKIGTNIFGTHVATYIS